MGHGNNDNNNDDKQKTVKIVPWPMIRGGGWPYHRRCFMCGQRDILRATLDGATYYCPSCDKARELGQKTNNNTPYSVADSDEDPTVSYKIQKRTTKEENLFSLDSIRNAWKQYFEWWRVWTEEWIERIVQKWYKF